MKEFFERLQIKHDLKREYFTLGIPVAVAVIFIILSVTLGMVKMPGEGGAAVQKDERQKAYEELLKQMNEGAMRPRLQKPRPSPLQRNSGWKMS